MMENVQYGSDDCVNKVLRRGSTRVIGRTGNFNLLPRVGKRPVESATFCLSSHRSLFKNYFDDSPLGEVVMMSFFRIYMPTVAPSTGSSHPPFPLPRDKTNPQSS